MERAVVVCNAFPDDNKGGCAITQQTIEWLKGVYPGSPVYIVPVEQSGGHDVRRHRFTLARHPDVGVLRSPIRTDGRLWTTFRRLLLSLAVLWGRSRSTSFAKTITEARLVVSKGGYVFVERDNLAGLLGLWFTAFPLILAAKRGVPTVALCTTVGPFRTRASGMLCRWILKDVGLVVTRDPISTREAQRLGCTDVREIPDIVVTFDEGRIGGATAPAHGSGSYGVVVLSPESPRLDAVFLARLADLCRRLLEDRVDRLIVPLQSHEDEPISRRFVAELGDPRVELVDDDLSPEDLMALYGGADFLIGRRLHAGVFALLVGVPVALFRTDGLKADGVMQELGLADRIFDYPDFQVEEVLRVIEEMTSPEERKRVREVVRRARVRAAVGLGAIAELVRESDPAGWRVEVEA